MRIIAHFICFVFGGGSIIFGMIGLFQGQLAGGVLTFSMGAALFLLSSMSDRLLEVEEIKEKLDLLIQLNRAGQPKP